MAGLAAMGLLVIGGVAGAVIAGVSYWNHGGDRPVVSIESILDPLDDPWCPPEKRGPDRTNW